MGTDKYVELSLFIPTDTVYMYLSVVTACLIEMFLTF